MTPIVALLVGILAVLAITVLTGYFVAQEFAYMAVDRSRLAARAAAGDGVAERTLGITRRTSFMLSGAQLGITVTGLIVGYVAEPLIGQSVASFIGGSSSAVSVAIGGAVALIFSTFVQMLFGELYPKNYAIARPEPVARWLSASTRIYLAVFGPVIWVFDKAAELFLRVLGIEPVHDVEHAATARDLTHLVGASRESGALPDELSDMLDRVLDFPERDVEHAMIPRSRVDVVEREDTVAEVRGLMATAHTRYPVLDEDDRILGVVELADVLRLPADCPDPVADHVRDPIVLSPYMTLPDALAELRSSGRRLACVVDEFGGFDGIITVEDIAEEVVGEITDEHDPEDPGYEPVPGDGVWVMPGDVHLDEVERALHVELPRGDFETIAGLVMQAHGALPADGEVVDVELPLDPALLVHEDEPDPRHLRVEVLEVDNYVPSRVRLTLPEGPADTRDWQEQDSDDQGRDNQGRDDQSSDDQRRDEEVTGR